MEDINAYMVSADHCTVQSTLILNYGASIVVEGERHDARDLFKPDSDISRLVTKSFELESTCFELEVRLMEANERNSKLEAKVKEMERKFEKWLEI